MILLSRQRTAAAIPAKYRGSRRVDHAILLLKARRAGQKPDEDYWKASKKQLKKESRGKCAYCESSAETVAHCDVEHFRPKSVYWWLAYCWDNYLLACQICNQSYKGDGFPVPGARLGQPLDPEGKTDAQLQAAAPALVPDPMDAPALAAFRAAYQGENAGLVDPYDADPELLFRWVADATLKEVRIDARAGNPQAPPALAAVTEHLGLNREELLRWRWKFYEELDMIRQLWDSAWDPARKQIYRSLWDHKTGEEAPYAAMARYFRIEWGLDQI